MEKIKNILASIKSFLFEFDFVWSLPLSFIGFLLFPIIGESLFGGGFAFYPPEFFHAAIYAGLLIVFISSMIQMGIYFHFPEMYQYYLKDFNNIKPEWLKPVLFLLFFFLFFFAMILIWAILV